MRLLHHATQPFKLDRQRVYVQPRDFKPSGLWVSVEGDYSWEWWCRGENFHLEGLEHTYEVKLVPEPKILFIENLAEFDDFERDFRHGDSNARGMLDIHYINWKKVKAAYDGIVIAPYQWDYRMSHMWYYPWDCASGCIWHLGAIMELKEVFPALPAPEVIRT